MIKLEDAVRTFIKFFENKRKVTDEPVICSALDALISFQQNYKIENVSLEPADETDELFVEYGVYGNPSKTDFTFNLVRQIQLIGEEEYHQIRLDFRFSDADFKDISSNVFWVMDYDSLNDWRKAVESNDAYKRSEQVEALAYSIHIDQT